MSSVPSFNILSTDEPAFSSMPITGTVEVLLFVSVTVPAFRNCPEIVTESPKIMPDPLGGDAFIKREITEPKTFV